MFTTLERHYMCNRLPMAATQHYLKTREKEDSVPPGTYLDTIDFSKHADVVMADRIKRRDVLQEHQAERERLGLSKPADDYNSDGKEILIADPMDLSPIIPFEVRQALSAEVPQGVKRPCPFESEPEPSIPKLAHSLSLLCTETERKDPQ